jgi:hypothetical protein
MLSGIYAAEFSANQNMGRGVAVFSGNAFHGVDASYFYKGKYKQEGTNQISAIVDVVNYSGSPDSVLGPLTSYRLTLTGIEHSQGFTLSGQVKGQPTLIRIALKKLDELVEA